MDNYKSQKAIILNALENNRLPQAMLFVGALTWAIKEFVQTLLPAFMCSQQGATACLSCLNCQMASRNEHPDIEWVRPEKDGAAIKIDQIRALQSSAFITAQRASYKIIIIDGADKMNNAASNALLKLLEEPAAHTKIILIAQHMSALLPTVISRCQTTHFAATELLTNDDLLSLGSLYPKDSGYASVTQQAESLLDELTALILGHESVCILAARWSKFDLNHLLWFLYLVYAQLQYSHGGKKLAENSLNRKLEKLADLLKPVKIFNQIEKINNILKKISHNINVNQTLALEELLLNL